MLYFSSMPASKLNVFLDSNILYANPYMNETFGALLLELSRHQELSIYISTVSLEEVKSNYKKQLSEKLLNIKKEWAKLSRLAHLTTPLPVPKEDALVRKLNDHLAELINANLLLPIHYDNDLLPELIKRSIGRLKPFTEKRQEFRDGVIWLSYVNYIRKHNLQENIFVSNNKLDFWDEDRKSLHPDLAADISGIKIYDGFESLFTEDSAIQAVVSQKNFREWFEKQSLDTAKVKHLIRRHLIRDMEAAMAERIDKVNPNKYFKGVDGVYFEYETYFHANSLLDFTASPVSDFAVVRCLISVPLTAFVYPKSNIWRKEKVECAVIIKFSFNLYNAQPEVVLNQVDSLEVQKI